MSFLEMPLEEQVRNLQAQDVAHLETIIALRAEVERLKAEVDRDRIEIENLRRWREIAKQCAEAMKLRGQHDNFDCIHDAGNMELCQCGKTERELFAIAEKSWIEALSADAEALKK